MIQNKFQQKNESLKIYAKYLKECFEKNKIISKLDSDLIRKIASSQNFKSFEKILENSSFLVFEIQSLEEFEKDPNVLKFIKLYKICLEVELFPLKLILKIQLVFSSK